MRYELVQQLGRALGLGRAIVPCEAVLLRPLSSGEQQAVRGGATTLVCVSLPTSMAVERARAAGLSLWALARGDSVLKVC